MKQQVSNNHQLKNKPLRILITHELFPPDFAGGGEKLVYETAKNLQQRGHQVKVLTTGNPKIKQYENIRTIRLSRNRYLMNFAFFKILKEARWADIIQTSTYNACFPSWLAGKIFHKPVVCLVMGYWGKQWQYMRKGIKGFFSQLIEKIQVHRSFDQKIFLSDFSRDFAFRSGMNKRNTIIINPGVEIENYHPIKKENFVLFSGRFAQQKGVYDCLKVAQLLPKVKFVMMGWGEEEEKIRKNSPKNVQFSNLSLKAGKPFFEMYGKAPIFFLPSYGETFGFVLVEAMASGCAIVSTIPLGYKGFLIKPKNVQQMARAIDYLVKHPSGTAKLGKKNIELAKKFTWEKYIDQLLQVYAKVLQKH
ncbi:MAG: glycosyltransferase family 4 protein [Nanoarchaeota archaeon]|nr:glycosyltransferase family 4 protein [Nanoarchaeota archaeon]MBU1623082.1 glycosyltransferase family 4 protein [Nanoarchaeota archaeon]MBU1974180.1 glycosyltransferase family 4 protein [Nanoarchaeota archaeon]